MKILFVSALMPYPLYSGGQVRVYNLLSRLTREHDITLATFLRRLDEKRYEKDLSFCKKIITCYRGHAWRPGYALRSFIGPKPLLLTSYDHAEFREEITAELGTGAYDLVHIEPWYVWPSLPKATVPIVVATHNIEYGIYAEYVRRLSFAPIRTAYYWDVLKLRWWEERVWRVASQIVAVSEEDARVIKKTVDAKVRVRIVPNGVDVKSFRFAMRHSTGAPVLLFIGSFTWMQNRDAVSWLMTSIWPALKAQCPGVKLRIVGRGMPASLRNLVAHHQVTLLEHVENIEDELHNADVLLAPIRVGGGTSFKILEAMAAGVPVVTTTLGATGLHVTRGGELLIGDTAEALIACVSQLLASDRMRSDLSQNARRTIEREYDWDTIARLLDRVWYETVKKRH